MEYQYESYAEMETGWKKMTANPPAWFLEIDPLLMNNDIGETWELVE